MTADDQHFLDVVSVLLRLAGRLLMGDVSRDSYLSIRKMSGD